LGGRYIGSVTGIDASKLNEPWKNFYDDHQCKVSLEDIFQRVSGWREGPSPPGKIIADFLLKKGEEKTFSLGARTVAIKLTSRIDADLTPKCNYLMRVIN
jgi:hypothetical protein